MNTPEGFTRLIHERLNELDIKVIAQVLLVDSLIRELPSPQEYFALAIRFTDDGLVLLEATTNPTHRFVQLYPHDTQS